MEQLKVKTNRRLEIDPLSGIIFPIEKGTLLGMNLNANSALHNEKAFLKLLPAGKALMLPYTHINIPYRGKEYSIFLTERRFNALTLFAADDLKDRMELLTLIQNRERIPARAKVLKVSISSGKATKKLVFLKEIEPLF